MVNKLRTKFVITAMLSLLLILVAMIALINIINVSKTISQADDMLMILADNDGYFPVMKGHANPNNPNKPVGADDPENEDLRNHVYGGPADPFRFDRLSDIRSAEMPYQFRYFFVRTDKDGNVLETDVLHIATVTEDEAKEFAASIQPSGKTKGFYHTYRFLTRQEDDGTSLIIFADISSQLLNAFSLLGQTMLVGLCTLIAMFILVFLFSGRAVAPVVESLEKQKRFITDAGHELKTPLAVISANVDVLEIESGKSEWTTSIRNQIKRMNTLVKNMLTLSRMDEEVMQVVYSDFDMSSVIKETALSFEAIAETKNKNYKMDIEDGIHITGDKNAINQLANLLLDNAMKYSSANGNIQVLLSKGKNIVLEVSNTCDDIPSGNLDRLFDRFYRADSSRSRESGGFGIGLSVARAIAVSHGGNIAALRDGDKLIRFVVTLPTQLPKNLQKLKA